MGRTQPTKVLQPAAFRKDARAKKAKATINKVIPQLLATHPRARDGINSSELITHASLPPSPPPPSSSGNAPIKISLCVKDTLTAAHSLLSSSPNSTSKDKDKVAILNMASPLSPGGGFLNGATSQEESLCMRTTLLPSLKDEFYRLPELSVIYTPDVLVFRDEKGEDYATKKERWWVDVISAAMLRQPDLNDENGGETYARQKDREMVIQKMRLVMRVLQQKGVKRVVLGAWGCGVYGNPVNEIAAAWKSVLLGKKAEKEKGNGMKERKWEGIEEVVFAVKERWMAERFAEAWRDELEVDEEEEDNVDEEKEEKEGNGTLEEKIKEMETAVEQARSPQLREGLGRVLAGLRAQLAIENTDFEDGAWCGTGEVDDGGE
ncbi:hypothetical protein QBC35DRAFT_421273 [Podospora australis]|uniref:Microbial-type PARG catalytic domain-containing protein n=1 Tax=Podospora australis TaxID=1536484 RepID=A0AAN7ADR7_9PEZI|nr:hypothetical protein QBC35DRAFT_421273 [Podospora australis]